MQSRKKPTLVGGLIREHREALGITQQDLADLAGVKRDLVSATENGYTGRRGISASTARMLRLLGVDAARALAATEEDGFGGLVDTRLSEDRVREVKARQALERVADRLTDGDVPRLLSFVREKVAEAEAGGAA